MRNSEYYIIYFSRTGKREVVNVDREPVQVKSDLLRSLSSHQRIHLYDVITDAHDLRGLYADILGLPLGTTHRLQLN